MNAIASRENPRVRRWRALARDARERKAQRKAWIEGEHLVTAYLQSGRQLDALVLSKSAASNASLLRLGAKPVIVSDAVFNWIADASTPAGIGAEIEISQGRGLEKAPSCVFLDGIQDSGNVGTLLRSAAAFGVTHAVLGKGCADAWSPKVLRAAAGAHFSLQIVEYADLAEQMDLFSGKIACTVPRGGLAPGMADLSGRIGWLLGAEGQGVSAALAAKAAVKVTIDMPGTAESLNVAAAAAICFYEMARKRRT